MYEALLIITARVNSMDHGSPANTPTYSNIVYKITFTQSLIKSLESRMHLNELKSLKMLHS